MIETNRRGYLVAMFHDKGDCVGRRCTAVGRLPGRRSRAKWLFGLLSCYFLGTLFLGRLQQLVGSEKTSPAQIRTKESLLARKLLSVSLKNGNVTEAQTENKTEACQPPSIKEFPADYFSNQQRKKGFVVLHIFTAMYMFMALAFVCDDYFVASLDKIVERLDMTDDVAGATFMAAGSSAPELFTSIIGVFIAHGDVGIGTIVGSAVFNLLIILAICGIFSGQIIVLTWWPLMRDSFYYSLSIAALIVTIYDGYVTWYESVIMLVMYLGYCLIMKFNNQMFKLFRRVSKNGKKHPEERKESPSGSGIGLMYRDDPNAKADGNGCGEMQFTGKRRPTWRELGMMIMLTNQFAPSSRFRAACLIVILRQEHDKDFKVGSDGDLDLEACNHVADDGKEAEDIQVSEEEVQIVTRPFILPKGSICKICFWLLTLPIMTVLYFTIPDCRKPKWEHWFLVTFLASIIWIALFSYMMVWMVTVIGFTIGVPDVIMGITFLAAGTSIPDAIASLIVARQGQGDMAVSNSIGSNVFDILIGLAVPWFIKSAIVSPGSSVRINSRGMVYSVALLFASVLFTILAVHINKWQLTRRLGFILCGVYCIFLLFSALTEFNVFAFVNLPTCKI